MEELPAGRPGFFGKLPARGDFVERRLDRGFCRGLDEWLSASLAAARAALGEAFLPAYLQAPIWRFALAPGVCGARGVLGVMMPSVDRVGRYFPLVIAAHVAAVGPLGALVDSAADWLDGAERLALGALDDDCTFEIFDEAVSALGAPPPGATDHPQHKAVWWNFGSDTAPPVALLDAGLPDATLFAAFIDGDPARWGWVSRGDAGVAGMSGFSPP